MPNFLQNLGNSQFANNIGDLVRTKLAFDQNARADQETNMRQALGAEQLERMKRINANERQSAEAANQPVAIESISNMIAGGANGPIFKMLYDYADANGYIDKGAGGLGSIKRKDLAAVQQGIMKDPFAGQQLSAVSMSYYRNQIAQADELLSKNPNDEKAKALRDQASNGLNLMVAHDDKLRLMMKQQQDAATEAAKTKSRYDLEIMRQQGANARAAESIAVRKYAADIGAASRLEATNRTIEGNKAKVEAKANAKQPSSAMERAFQAKRQEPGMENLSLDEFKNTFWNQAKETGKITTQGALKSLEGIAGYDPSKIAQMQKEFFGLKKSGMSAEEAYNAIIEKSVAPSPSGTSDYSTLWK